MRPTTKAENEPGGCILDPLERGDIKLGAAFASRWPGDERMLTARITFLFSLKIVSISSVEKVLKLVASFWKGCLFVCAEFFSAVFDPISIQLRHMLYVWV